MKLVLNCENIITTIRNGEIQSVIFYIKSLFDRIYSKLMIHILRDVQKAINFRFRINNYSYNLYRVRHVCVILSFINKCSESIYNYVTTKIERRVMYKREKTKNAILYNTFFIFLVSL